MPHDVQKLLSNLCAASKRQQKLFSTRRWSSFPGREHLGIKFAGRTGITSPVQSQMLTSQMRQKALCR